VVPAAHLSSFFYVKWQALPKERRRPTSKAQRLKMGEMGLANPVPCSAQGHIKKRCSRKAFARISLLRCVNQLEHRASCTDADGEDGYRQWENPDVGAVYHLEMFPAPALGLFASMLSPVVRTWAEINLSLRLEQFSAFEKNLENVLLTRYRLFYLLLASLPFQFNSHTTLSDLDNC
jgi:hypothetical protein